MTEPVKTTLSGVEALVAKRIAFDCNGTLRSFVIQKGSYQMERLLTEFRTFRRFDEPRDNPFGQLPGRYGQALVNDLIDNEQTYVIYSYETPIAWTGSQGEWIVPPVKYSATTSKHLGKTGILHLPNVMRDVE